MMRSKNPASLERNHQLIQEIVKLKTENSKLKRLNSKLQLEMLKIRLTTKPSSKTPESSKSTIHKTRSVGDNINDNTRDIQTQTDDSPRSGPHDDIFSNCLLKLSPYHTFKNQSPYPLEGLQ